MAFKKRNPGCSSAAACQCGPSNCSLTVYVHGCGNGNFPIADDPITVKDSTGTVVFQGATDSTGKLVVPVPKSGTYTASRDTASCAGGVASGSVTVTCPSTNQAIALSTSYTVNFTLIGCGGNPPLFTDTRPNLRVYDHATGTLIYDNAFTFNPASGSATFCVPWLGDYDYYINGNECYQDEGPFTFNVSGCTTTLTHTLIMKLYDITYQVTGCNLLNAGSGVTVELSCAAFDLTRVTDATGQVTFTQIPTSCPQYTITVSYPRNQISTTISGPLGCGPVVYDVELGPPADGYTCLNCAWYPVPTTLFVTDSNTTLPLAMPGGTTCYLAPEQQVGTCFSGGCLVDFNDPNSATVLQPGQPALSYGWSVDCQLRGNYSVCVNLHTFVASLACGVCHDGDIARTVQHCGDATADTSCNPGTLSVALVTGPPPVPPFSMQWSVSNGPAPGTVLIGE